MDTQQFETRKRDHIRYSLDQANQAKGLSGLSQVRLVHEALPDLNFAEVDLSSNCLGRVLPTPFYVAGMTAGHPDALQINRILAEACQERGWAMGVGSQRRELENPSEPTPWLSLRKEVPDLMLFANIGITQLIQYSEEQIRRLVEDLGADALVVHTNALQEALQSEGTPLFRGGLKALKRICEFLSPSSHQQRIPVVLKETGCGFSRATLERIGSLGLAAVDVSGLGGTHWGRVEGSRAERDSLYALAATTFANWGIATAESVRSASQVLTQQEIWASGGVRSGLDAAKLVALGAHRVGYAQPALEAALEGPQRLRSWMESQEFELKIALFCTGSSRCSSLREKEGSWKLSVD